MAILPCGMSIWGLWQPCEDVEGVLRRTYEKFGGMPSMVTEFGLCEPAFEGGDERRAQILRERIPVYKSLEKMAGYVWFRLFIRHGLLGIETLTGIVDYLISLFLYFEYSII